MNLGKVNKTRCTNVYMNIQSEYGQAKKHLLQCLTAVRLLPEDRQQLKNVHTFAHRDKDLALTEMCLKFWQTAGIVNENNNNWSFTGNSEYEAKKLCESYGRRSEFLAKYYLDEGKVSFAEVSSERKKLERSMYQFDADANVVADLVECLKKRNLKEAAFMYADMSDEGKQKLSESLDTFLSHLYNSHYENVLMNDDYRLGEDAISKLTNEEKKVLVNTMNIFMAENNEFNVMNIHEASNIGVQMAISKANKSAPDTIKSVLDSINEKLMDEDIANAVGDGSSVAGLNIDDPVPPKKKKKREKFAGKDVFKVSEQEYDKCMPGKIKYERWSKTFDEDSEVGMEIKNYARRNPNTPFIVQNEKSGEMMFFTRHENPRRGKKE